MLTPATDSNDHRPLTTVDVGPFFRLKVSFDPAEALKKSALNIDKLRDIVLPIHYAKQSKTHGQMFIGRLLFKISGGSKRVRLWGYYCIKVSVSAFQPVSYSYTCRVGGYFYGESGIGVLKCAVVA